MISKTTCYGTVQRKSRCNDHVNVVDINNAAGMDETYGTYVDDDCFGIHDYDDDTDHDTNDDTEDGTDDDTKDDAADDDTDDGGRGNLSRHEEAYWYTRIL